MNDNQYLPYIRENHEELAPIYLEDLDAILPVVIKVNRTFKLSADREEITSIDIYSSMEAATSTDYKTQAAGILCECYLLEDLPGSTVERIEAAIEAKAEIARRHRETDNELAEMCRSILMAGMRVRS